MPDDLVTRLQAAGRHAGAIASGKFRQPWSHILCRACVERLGLNAENMLRAPMAKCCSCRDTCRGYYRRGEAGDYPCLGQHGEVPAP